MGIGDCPVVVVFPLAHIKIAFLTAERFIYGSRDTSNRARAEDKVDARYLLKDRLALELGNTSHHTNNRFCCTRMTYFPDPRIEFVFSPLPNRACVKNTASRRFLVLCHLKSIAGKRRRNALRVRDVHLTPKGFEIHFF